MRMHVLALAASAAALVTAPLPAYAQSGSPLGSLFSCDNPNGNNRTGAVVGGLAGALLGSQVSKNERALGAIVGAAAGAAAGNYIGCRMNSNSRAGAQNAFEQALNTGRPQTWSDSQSGASGRIEVVSGGGYNGGQGGGYDNGRPISTNDLRYGRGIERVRSMTSTAPRYIADGAVNVRAAPSTRAAVVDRLTRGRSINVAGMVSGSWLAVEENGRIDGYVSASTVRPAGPTSYARNDNGCRVVQQTITQRGYANETTRYNACRERDGQWRVNPI